jgi:hypothetical protein
MEIYQLFIKSFDYVDAVEQTSSQLFHNLEDAEKAFDKAVTDFKGEIMDIIKTKGASYFTTKSRSYAYDSNGYIGNYIKSFTYEITFDLTDDNHISNLIYFTSKNLSIRGNDKQIMTDLKKSIKENASYCYNYPFIEIELCKVAII